MKTIESFTGFQPLKEAWIGGVYPTSFYKHLPNEIEDTFCHITELTQKSFDNLKKKLQQLNVKVHSPLFEKSVDLYMDEFDNLIKPPVAPRDWVIALGNELLITPQGYKKEPYSHAINYYKEKGENVQILDRSDDPRAWIGFPGIVRIGKRLIVDTGYTDNDLHLKKIKEAMQKYEKEYKIFYTNEGGHLDSVFCPVKKDILFSSHWGEQTFYEETFPGWEVFWIKNKKNNNHIQGNWWSEENNFYSPIFSKHIEEKAANWVGNSTETVFEANMLIVDEHNVICIAEHEQSFKRMKELGITPHVVDFPTRYFWDGGIHCVTVDIRREGGCKNYFND
jgi:hypothetical protein